MRKSKNSVKAKASIKKSVKSKKPAKKKQPVLTTSARQIEDYAQAEQGIFAAGNANRAKSRGLTKINAEERKSVKAVQPQQIVSHFNPALPHRGARHH